MLMVGSKDIPCICILYTEREPEKRCWEVRATTEFISLPKNMFLSQDKVLKRIKCATKKKTTYYSSLN